ncbi:MAG: exopolyphosphatase [Desulfuromonadales bacterium]|nr:exopolyphosphatase [Desulfuromonadales bacterium]
MRAAVDVGTNTVRLLIGKAPAGRIEPHHYFRRITRLGGGYREPMGLAPEAAERTWRALEEIAERLQVAGVRQLRAVGTAVLREASNGPDFVRRVVEGTGLPLEIISGEEEALLTARGVLSVLDPLPETALLIDLGGGSTELVLCHRGTILFHRSYPLGVVRLAEALPEAAAQQERIAAVLAEAHDDLVRHRVWSLVASPDCRLVGTAGTVTTLAALHLGLAEYDWRRVNNLVMHRDELQALACRLQPLTATQRETLAGMEAGRGDLILPGVLVVLSLLDLFHRPDLTVSDFGLLEGVLLSQEPPMKPFQG